MPLDLEHARKRLRAELGIEAEPDDPIFASYFLGQLALVDLRPEIDEAVGKAVADAKAGMGSNLTAIRAAADGLVDLREGMDATAKGAETALTNAARLEAAAVRLERAAKARGSVSGWIIFLAALCGSLLGTGTMIAALPYLGS